MKSAKWPKLREAPGWRGASVAERARAIENACRTAMELLEDSKEREARLRRIDPVPNSTRAIIRRLAAEGNAKRKKAAADARRRRRASMAGRDAHPT